jgi:hypothetical protein
MMIFVSPDIASLFFLAVSYSRRVTEPGPPNNQSHDFLTLPTPNPSSLDLSYPAQSSSRSIRNNHNHNQLQITI